LGGLCGFCFVILFVILFVIFARRPEMRFLALKPEFFNCLQACLEALGFGACFQMLFAGLP